MSIESKIFFKPNAKKCAVALVHIMVCSVNDTICTCRVKREIESEGIWNEGNVGQNT